MVAGTSSTTVQTARNRVGWSTSALGVCNSPIEVGIRWRAGRNAARVLPLRSSSDGEYGGGLGILRYQG